MTISKTRGNITLIIGDQHEIQGPRHRAPSDSMPTSHSKTASHSPSGSARNTHHAIGLVESGSSFWVFAHRDLVMELRKGKDVPMSDIVQDLSIFTGSTKGEPNRASKTLLDCAFGHMTKMEIARRIVQVGGLQAATHGTYSVPKAEGVEETYSNKHLKCV